MALLSRSSGDDGTTAVEETVAPATRTLSTGMPKVNLLPPEITEARRVRVVQAGVGVGALAAVAIVGGLWYNAHSGLSDAKKQHDAAVAKQAQLQQDVARYGDVDLLFRKVDAANAMVSAATANEVHWSNYLDDLSIALPDHVWLTNLTMAVTPGGGATAGAASGTVGAAGAANTSIGTVNLSGSAYVHNDVANLLERLAGLKGFFNVYLSNSTEALVGTTAKVPTVNWTATSQLDSDALAPKTNGGNR